MKTLRTAAAFFISVIAAASGPPTAEAMTEIQNAAAAVRRVFIAASIGFVCARCTLVEAARIA